MYLGTLIEIVSGSCSESVIKLRNGQHTKKIITGLNAMANSFTRGLTCSINLNRIASKQMVVSSCNEKAQTSFTRCSYSFLVAIFRCQVFLAGDSSKLEDASITHFLRPKSNRSPDCYI